MEKEINRRRKQKGVCGSGITVEEYGLIIPIPIPSEYHITCLLGVVVGVPVASKLKINPFLLFLLFSLLHYIYSWL